MSRAPPPGKSPSTPQGCEQKVRDTLVPLQVGRRSAGGDGGLRVLPLRPDPGETGQSCTTGTSSHRQGETLRPSGRCRPLFMTVDGMKASFSLCSPSSCSSRAPRCRCRWTGSRGPRVPAPSPSPTRPRPSCCITAPSRRTTTTTAPAPRRRRAPRPRTPPGPRPPEPPTSEALHLVHAQLHSCLPPLLSSSSS